MVDAVTLGVDVAEALPGFRSEAESLMVDTVLVERATGGVSTDTLTLEETLEYTTIYVGAARVQRVDIQPNDQVVGEVEFSLLRLNVQLPLSVTGIERNDRVTVTAIGPVTDPELSGVVAAVQANLTKTHPTKRTLVCQEVT